MRINGDVTPVGRHEITTLFTGTVGASSSTAIFDLGITTESEVWILVNTDQQPWTASVRNFPWNSAGTDQGLFPKRSAVATTYPNALSPAFSLVLGIPASSGFGLTAAPTTIEEARNYAIPFQGLTYRFDNGAAAAANVTIKVLRIWR